MTSLALRLLSIPAVIAVVLAGLWVAGGVITNDFALAMWLTVAWMGVAGVGALAIALRSRSYRWPVLGAYAATAAAVGVYLGASVFLDREVNERVAVASPVTAASDSPQPADAPPANELLRAGTFEAVRHAAQGRAAVIRLAGGGRVLTLTDFEVDNGPDLRVQLVPGAARSEDEVDGVIDLGGLKGNRGNQQYTIPDDVRLDGEYTAIVWCRAFSVLFARAALERAATESGTKGGEMSRLPRARS
jgi:hypothetical protein